MSNFVQNLKTLERRAQYEPLEKCRAFFPELSDDDFSLLWSAAMLNLTYQYDRNGKVSGTPSDGLSDEYKIENFKPISGESSTK